jgi:cytochrome c
MRKLLALASLLGAFSSTAALADNHNMVELANKSGCFVCHAIEHQDGGAQPLAPAYRDIAARYKDNKAAFGDLVNRVLHGTAYQEQHWAGTVNMRFMPPNVNLGREDAAALVNWVLSMDPAEGVSAEVNQHDQMLALAATSGCMTCHEVEGNSNPHLIPLAPGFRDIATRYSGQDGARKKLLHSVRFGTVSDETKAWPNVNMRFMPPNVALNEQHAAELVDWIIGLRPNTK